MVRSRAMAESGEMSTEDEASSATAAAAGRVVVVVEDVAQSASAFQLLLACPAGVPVSSVRLHLSLPSSSCSSSRSCFLPDCSC